MPPSTCTAEARNRIRRFTAPPAASMVRCHASVRETSATSCRKAGSRMSSTQHPGADSSLVVAAVTRRDDAREGYDRLAGMATAASGTAAHDESVDLRDAAYTRLVACEAWLGWLRAGI